ncbi:glycine zipper domain-containing protein [Pyrococcus yayanosii]|uniref:Glycine zipper domain-containing protein n=1 Tax=Pyrococcus yayanosii (strain CH1 / JCM 16557) TaxID=529709 RepID=F8AG33_PYRYC|nr:glycine zipper domain-containing protein [Pyrococcus yayanosii]AEH25087.1 hypothetical protein PYCH_14170 [Pyrococcus yayanosii CH1]
MGLFFSLFRPKEDEDIVKDEKRKRKVAGIAIMLMLLISIYAEPVAAWEWPKPNWEAVVNFFDTLKNNLLGGVGGALAGAKVGASIGAMVGGPVGAAIGALAGGVIGFIGGSYLEQKIKEKIANTKLGQWLGLSTSETDFSGLLDTGKNVTLANFTSDYYIKNSLVSNLTREADMAALQDLQILISKLQSSIINYDFQASGDSGEFADIVLKGPEKIYGFSAFPIELELRPRGNSEVKDPICLTSVKIYAKDENGNIYWTRTWTFGEDEECLDPPTSFVWSFPTILKGPDPYVGYINDVLNGLADEKLVKDIFNATPEKFEIVAEVSGYRKIYYQDGSGNWIFDHNEPIHAVFTSLSAYRHIGGGTYVISGFAGSLPIYYQDSPEASEFTAFQMKAAGASSNLVARLWSSPLHILSATAPYKVYIQGNPGYFGGLNPAITDEARIVVYRITKDGHWELAAALPLEGVAHLGDLSAGKLLQGSVTYHADDSTISYRAFIVVKAWIQRDDGAQIPVWILMEPAIAPVDPTRKVTMDQYIEEIGNLVGDNSITLEEAQRLKAIADSLISSLQSKIEVAQSWKEKGEAENKDLVVEYASKAIYHYKEAIKYAEKLKNTDNSQDVLKYAEIVKEEEVIGDYYVRAAELAYYGQEGQAQSLVEDASKIEQNVKEIKGFSWLSFPTDWSDIKQVLPFLLKILASIAAIYISKQLFGGVGALIVAGIVFVWWIGPMFGISL